MAGGAQRGVTRVVLHLIGADLALALAHEHVPLERRLAIGAEACPVAAQIDAAPTRGCWRAWRARGCRHAAARRGERARLLAPGRAGRLFGPGCGRQNATERDDDHDPEWARTPHEGRHYNVASRFEPIPDRDRRLARWRDRKSTRLNSSHVSISY